MSASSKDPPRWTFSSTQGNCDSFWNLVLILPISTGELAGSFLMKLSQCQPENTLSKSETNRFSNKQITANSRQTQLQLSLVWEVLLIDLVILETLLNCDLFNNYEFEGFFIDLNKSDRILFVTISSPERLGSLYLDESILEVLSNPEQLNGPFLKLLSEILKKLSSLKF